MTYQNADKFSRQANSCIYCSLLNTPTVRSRDGVLPASSLLSLKRQGNEVEAGNTPTVRSWEVYLSKKLTTYNIVSSCALQITKRERSVKVHEFMKCCQLVFCEFLKTIL